MSGLIGVKQHGFEGRNVTPWTEALLKRKSRTLTCIAGLTHFHDADMLFQAPDFMDALCRMACINNL